ncbi:MAG: DUF5723 family protein [Bacteroidia bacterium]
MKKLLVTLIVCSFGLGSVAQNNLTLYNMKPLPQRLQANPALTPDCKWYIGMPALSSLDFNFASNALAIKTLNNSFTPRPGGGYTLEINKLSDALDKQTFLNIGLNEEWLNFGFRVRKSMFTFGITEKVKTRVSIPKDILKLAFQGNGGDNLGYDFNFNFGLDVLHTREFALGYSRQFFSDKLTLGTRLKYIQGLNVINTSKNDVIFNTADDDFAYKVSADIELNASTPFMDSNIDPTRAALGSPKNSGFGIDVGANFDLTKRISISASVVDLGQITWIDNVSNLRSRNPGATFTYSGIDINDYLNDTSGSAGFSELGDTLLDLFALDTFNNSFSTGLLGEFYLGGNFAITKKHNAGVLFYGSFYNKEFYPALTLSWNSKFTRKLAVSASYTMMKGSFQNFGLGMASNLGPEQLYFVSDNLIGAATGNVKNLGIRFGWNHTFGRRSYENGEKRQDKKNKRAKRRD